MKVTKLKIKNLYGIEELNLDGKSIELVGSNGVGKSSVLDAIRLALTNNSKRKYIVKKGETEGSVYVELDNGITIDRKKRTDKSDSSRSPCNNTETASKAASASVLPYKSSFSDLSNFAAAIWNSLNISDWATTFAESTLIFFCVTK